MTSKLIGLLREIENAIPPPTNCHHVLTRAQFGSDEKGWEERLALQVNQDGKFWCFFLGDADFEKTPKVLAHEVRVLIETPDPAAQIGIGLGQYVETVLKPAHFDDI